LIGWRFASFSGVSRCFRFWLSFYLEPVDLFYAHIGGMDAFARGLKIAAAIRADGRLAELVKNRYASWDSGIGASIEAGKEDFSSLEKHAMSRPDPVQYTSGRQELLENIVNELI
jgi:xylose isomerase